MPQTSGGRPGEKRLFKEKVRIEKRKINTALTKRGKILHLETFIFYALIETVRAQESRRQILLKEKEKELAHTGGSFTSHSRELSPKQCAGERSCARDSERGTLQKRKEKRAARKEGSSARAISLNDFLANLEVAFLEKKTGP